MSLSSFQCRSCGSNHGELVLDLGIQPLANNLLRREDLEKPEPRFPLRLAVCNSCWLVQIIDLVPPVEMFSEYLYFSSFSDETLRHARAAVESHTAEFALGSGSRVVEIASNDGYLLQNFVKTGIPCFGIEPAANIAKVAREKGIETLVEFFGSSLARRLVSEGRQADLILANNVFAHAPDTNDFVSGLKTLLKPAGRIVLEFPYVGDFLAEAEFDTIYHEHVFYFSLSALVPLFSRHGLEIFRVARMPIHGGSLRLFVGHAGGHAVDPSVAGLLAEESRRAFSSMAPYGEFASHVLGLKQELTDLLQRLKGEGKSIAAYGASAKGSTLMNFFGISRHTLDFVADRSTYKHGRFTPGTFLPVAPAEELLRRMPDYTLLLTWNFATEILNQQSAYRERGGRFIIPHSTVRIV